MMKPTVAMPEPDDVRGHVVGGLVIVDHHRGVIGVGLARADLHRPHAPLVEHVEQRLFVAQRRAAVESR